MTAPLLVFGWGNPSRGDDALGPLFVERLRGMAERAGLGGMEFLEDYQLQVEHALDLVGRVRVLFVDASLDCRAPFEATAVRAARDLSLARTRSRPPPSCRPTGNWFAPSRRPARSWRSPG